MKTRNKCVAAAILHAAVFSPAFCQSDRGDLKILSDLYMSQRWVQVLPAPARGSPGTATVTKRSGSSDFFQIDLAINGAATTSSVAAVMIDTEATLNPQASQKAISSFDYGEWSMNLGMGTQFAGPAVRQNGKIYVLATLIAPSSASWALNNKTGLTSADLVELHTDGKWLDFTSRPDFSAKGSIIEFGFWRGSGISGSSGAGPSCEMYYCPPAPSAPSISTSYGVNSWVVDIYQNAAAPTAANVSTSDTTSSDNATDPVLPGTGEYYETAQELALGGPLPLTFIRYYGSLLQANGVTSAVGANWTHNFEASLAQDSTQATVRLFRGKSIRFVKGAGGSWQAGAAAYPYQLVAAPGGGFRFLDAAENLIYSFDGSGALTRIEDRNGNALTVTRSTSSPGPDRVSDGLGRSLSFSYSGGKLARVEDQRGRAITFGYTGDNLTVVTGVNGKTTRYSYSGGGLLISKTLPAGNTPISQTFDSRGRVVRQTDGLGYSATLSYDTPGAGVTTVTGPLNTSFQYTYQGHASLVSQIDPAGQSISFSYDSSNRLVQITDRVGGKKITAYDPVSGLAATSTDALGNLTRYSYTPQTQAGFTFYNLTRATGPDAKSSSFSYDAAGNIIASTDAAGATTRFTRNARGQPLSITNPAGGVSVYTYNDDGTLASLRQPAQGITSFGYDDKKRLVKITQPDQTARTTVYDDDDHIISETNETGLQESSTYNDNKLRASLTTPLSGTVAFSYDANQRVSSYSLPALGTKNFEYDPAGRLKNIPTPTGETVSLSFDPQHRPTAIAYCSGRGLGFAYDKEGRIASVTDGPARTWTVSSDASGNITQIGSPLGRQFRYTYDAAGRIASFTDPLSHTTQLTRDGVGGLLSLLRPDGVAVSQTRNELGLASVLTDAGGNKWQWSYDAGGHRTGATDPLGHTVIYQRDARGRTSMISFAEGSAQLSHDGAGNETRRLYSDGLDLNFAFDVKGRPVQATGVSLSYSSLGKTIRSSGIDIGRDDGFHISSIAYGPGKTIRYSYDCNGLLTSVSDWAGGVTTLGYDDARKLVSIQRPNGVTSSYSFDVDGRLTGIVESNGGMMSSIALTRDGAGNIASADRNVPMAPNPAPGVGQFSYDAAGQLAGGTYDSLGRPLTQGVRSYTWDLAGRLSSYSGSDGTASFGYDAYGMRTSRNAAGASQTYVINYALARPALSIVRQDGADLRYYVYLPDGRLLYSLDAAGDSRSFYHFDEAGSTLFLTGDDGAITDYYAGTPYGEQVDHTGPSDNPFTYLGAYGVFQEGATGLYYMGFRYYDSATARFLTKAPGLEPDLRYPNLYQYAKSNPLAFIDPMGQGPNAGRDANLSEGGDFAQLVLSLPEMFRPRERANTNLLPPALVRGLLDFATGTELRRDTKP